MVSVLMAAYNNERYIDAAIESILAQTYRDFEFLIINDGSTDTTFDRMTDYAQKDDRIRILTQKNHGLSRTLNRGIREARYDWVAIMDSDDIALPQRLERQIRAAAANPKVVVWGGYFGRICPEDKILSLHQVGPTTEAEFHRLRARGRFVQVCHSTALLNTQIVRRAGGYDPRFKASVDRELFDRLAEYGPILVLPETLALYRLNPDSITMANCFEQRMLGRYVRARHEARLVGNGEPNLDDFVEQYRARRFPRHLRTHLRDLCDLHRRKAAMQARERRSVMSAFYLGAAYFLTTVVRPRYVPRRIWNRVLFRQEMKRLRRFVRPPFGQEDGS